MKTPIKTLATSLAMLSLPFAAFAGGSHVWQKNHQSVRPDAAALTANAQPARVLSSTDLGMYYSRGPGKDSTSNRISIPGTVYTLEEPTEKSQSFNKRAMIMELKEDLIKGNAL
ncbi:MAG: hypothetical protein FJY37_16015 [Betaproteobacteria bacterium]|nr:hypothetical protein [Betaproteobacteria bacterium]